jgi:hypothetical protein
MTAGHDAMSCQEKNPIDALVLQSDAPDRWENALYAFLAEKECRSGSVRSVFLAGVVEHELPGRFRQRLEQRRDANLVAVQRSPMRAVRPHSRCSCPANRACGAGGVPRTPSTEARAAINLGRRTYL